MGLKNKAKTNVLAKRLNLLSGGSLPGKNSKTKTNNKIFKTSNGKNGPTKAQALQKNPLFKALNSSIQKSSLATQKSKTKNGLGSKPKTETNTSNKSDKFPNGISFKNHTTALTKFLRIYNVVAGSTESDVTKVLSSISPVKKVLLKKQDNGDCMAEVFFTTRDQRILDVLYDSFHGKLLDGNILKCSIASKSEIIDGRAYDNLIKKIYR